jgi:peptide/nickel transport system substrate-binding protein
MRHLRPTVLVLAALTLAVALAAGLGGAGAQSRRELRVGVAGVPGALDPATALDGAVPLISRHVFDTLVRYRELSTDVEPALATRWNVSVDGLTWTFVLRDNVKFHDGTPLSAFEGAASFERQLHPEDLQSPSGTVWAALLRGRPGVVKEVRAPDPRTLQIILSQPYAPLLSALAHPGFGIVRRVTGADGASQLVGSGPYRVVDASAGRVAIEAVPGHWSGASRAERIVFLDMASSEQAEAELDARAIDVWLPPAAPRRAEGLSIPGLHVGYLALQTEKEPFSRKPLRHAIASALDPAALAAALERAAVPLQSFLPPGVWARREGAPILGGGRESVKKLLAQGGWPKSMKPTLLVATSAASPELTKVGEAVQTMLEAAGMPVTLRVEPEETARAALQSGGYHLALTEATVLAGDPHFLLFPLSTTEAAMKGRALNYSYYRNQRLDALLIRASQLSYRPERQRLYLRAQVMLDDELPWIPLYARLVWAVARPEVRGLRLHPTSFHRFSSVTVEGAAARSVETIARGPGDRLPHSRP